MRPYKGRGTGLVSHLVLAQRAAAEGPRWTRAGEDQSAPIPEEITSELGESIYAGSTRAVGDHSGYYCDRGTKREDNRLPPSQTGLIARAQVRWCKEVTLRRSDRQA
jgi:hypothetical protein